MAKPAYVSLQTTAAGGRSEHERARGSLLIQYGSDYEKEATFELDVRGMPADPFDYAEQSRALHELVAALEAWRAEGGQIYTERRTG